MFGLFQKKPTQEELAQQAVDYMAATIKAFGEGRAKDVGAQLVELFKATMVGKSANEVNDNLASFVDEVDNAYKNKMIEECKTALGTLYTAIHENPDKTAGEGMDQMIDDMATMGVVYVVQDAMFLRDDYLRKIR